MRWQGARGRLRAFKGEVRFGRAGKVKPGARWKMEGWNALPFLPFWVWQAWTLFPPEAAPLLKQTFRYGHDAVRQMQPSCNQAATKLQPSCNQAATKLQPS
jgi:hypothetical protein